MRLLVKKHTNSGFHITSRLELRDNLPYITKDNPETSLQHVSSFSSVGKNRQAIKDVNQVFLSLSLKEICFT